VAKTFRTTVSIVYWTDTTDEAQSISDTLAASVPADDRDRTLVTIEYRPDGQPEPADADETEPEPEP
jgi:hypothetical protein